MHTCEKVLPIKYQKIILFCPVEVHVDYQEVTERVVCKMSIHSTLCNVQSLFLLFEEDNRRLTSRSIIF